MRKGEQDMQEPSLYLYRTHLISMYYIYTFSYLLQCGLLHLVASLLDEIFISPPSLLFLPINFYSISSLVDWLIGIAQGSKLV